MLTLYLFLNASQNEQKKKINLKHAIKQIGFMLYKILDWSEVTNAIPFYHKINSNIYSQTLKDSPTEQMLREQFRCDAWNSLQIFTEKLFGLYKEI